MLARSSSTAGTSILVTDIPADIRTEEDLKWIFEVYPGGVRKVWIQRDYSRLAKKVAERDALVLQLEKAETRLIGKAVKSHQHQQAGAFDTTNHATVWRHYLSPKQREYCWLPPLSIAWLPAIPFVGQRRDLIEHSRKMLADLNQSILDERSRQNGTYRGSAIIQFGLARGAQMACQTIHHSQPYLLGSAHVEDSAEHIIWRNLSLSWKERYVRTFAVRGAVIALFLCCVVPVAFTGLLSQLTYLATLWPWLAWLELVPHWCQGALQGVLPPALLATVTLTVPIILKRLIIEQGVHTDTAAELVLQDYFFGFLFLQLFLVVSVSATLATVFSGLEGDFESLASLLALSLPKTGNYFLSYILLQGLSVSAGALLQPNRLLRFLTSSLRVSTPRESWDSQKPQEIQWGTFFPVYTNLAAIGLVYSVVSPLILVVNIVAFGLFLIAQSHVVRHVSFFNLDTGGLVYHKAIQQLFVGLYVMEGYLALLFWLVRDENDKIACAGQGLIMIMAVLCTMIYQILLTQAYGPLLKHLPVMAAKKDDSSDTKAPVQRTQAVWDVLDIVDTLLGRSRETVIHQEPRSCRDTTDVIDTVLNSKQPVIWLPMDSLGISKDEVARTIRAGLRASDIDTNMEDTGDVKCFNQPPEASDADVQTVHKPQLWAQPLITCQT
ncbi:MAG: hypothetical protein Q9217_001779 [Psora testacea]